MLNCKHCGNTQEREEEELDPTEKLIVKLKIKVVEFFKCNKCGEHIVDFDSLPKDSPWRVYENEKN